MAAKVTVISTRQDSGFDANGRAIETMRTEFKIGDDGPFVVRIPKEGWSAEQVNQEIDRVRRELEAIRTE